MLHDFVRMLSARAREPCRLPPMTMKTQTHGFLNFYPCTIVMGLRSAALRAAVELRYNWHKNTYILLDVLLCSIAEYFYELCRILTSP